MKNFVQHTLFPLIAAMIWGTAFSAQSIASRTVQPFAVNAFRGLVAFAVLALTCLVLKIHPGKKKDVILGSMLCGLALFLASNLQQYGISETSAGKSGFLTALYIVLVPVFGTFLHKKTSSRVWLAVAVAVTGMYFLCIKPGVSFGSGDLALVLCAFLFTAQILGIDFYTGKVHPVALSAGQLFVCGFLSLIVSVFFETTTLSDFGPCLFPMLYVALFSSCVAYTLQIFAQKGGNPSVVSLLLSMESVFALFGGMILLGEKLTGREYLGCTLMAFAIVLSQLPEKNARKGAA